MNKAASAPAIEYSVGKHHPLGACRDGQAVNFAVAVPGAPSCTLKLSFSDGVRKILLDDKYRFGSVFAVRITGLPQDFTYSYEALGRRFTDPYAKGIKGKEEFGLLPKGLPEAYLPDESFDWKDDKHPGIPFNELIIYKLHVRGFTMDASSGVKNKGTYQGLQEKLPYIKKLGVNAILLTPCVDFDECMTENFAPPIMTEEMLKKGSFHKEEPAQPTKVNFWGYGANANYYTPKASFAADKENPGREFKKLVRRFHEAGIEVLMELSFPAEVTTNFVVSVCRHWVDEYHLDGFRFINLPISDFALSRDPYLADTKLILNSWDESRAYPGDSMPRIKNLASMDGGFEYNARRFLKGDEGIINGFTEIHRRNGLRVGVINQITDNNGFTLKDLYSYDVKHNENNGENNRDGREVSYSWNCGKEGETQNRKILERRKTMICNALLTLFSAQGIPMLLAGDEFLNSQQGNNNAYCQDNSCGWLNWNKCKAQREITAFLIKLIEIRKAHQVLRNNEPLRAMDYVSYGCPDISYHGIKAWGPDFSYYSKTVGMLLNGEYARTRAGKADDSIYILFNMDSDLHSFDLPVAKKNKTWEVLACTVNAAGAPAEGQIFERSVELPARSAIIFKEH